MDDEVDPKIGEVRDGFLHLVGEIVKLSVVFNELSPEGREAVIPRYRAFLAAVSEMPVIPQPHPESIS